jgi:putative restriction endonuclease
LPIIELTISPTCRRIVTVTAMIDPKKERSIRFAAFDWLREREARNGGIFSWDELSGGFSYEGSRITLIGQTGIWFPQGFSLPISITTSAIGPYALDNIGDDGVLTYAYRGTDPELRDNRGLREALRTRTPLIYFHALRPGRYQAAWPITIFQDDPKALCVRAAIDPVYAEPRFRDAEEKSIGSPLDVRRYITIETKRRLHQGAFRELVLEAYDRRCTICSLRHPELLDAAHIIADNTQSGLPIVPNGLSLCKIHHAAFDQNILGVSPDYHVHIREDILQEHDGPMLRHGLQELNGVRIILPSRRSDRPDSDRLAARFEALRMLREYSLEKASAAFLHKTHHLVQGLHSLISPQHLQLDTRIALTEDSFHTIFCQFLAGIREMLFSQAASPHTASRFPRPALRFE